MSSLYHYDVKNKVFNTTSGYSNPVWDDDLAYSPTFDIAYDTAYLTANTQGLLILHTQRC